MLRGHEVERSEWEGPRSIRATDLTTPCDATGTKWGGWFGAVKLSVADVNGFEVFAPRALTNP